MISGGWKTAGQAALHAGACPGAVLQSRGHQSVEVVSSRALGPDRRGRERMQLRLQVSTMEGKSSSDDIVLVQDDGQWRIAL